MIHVPAGNDDLLARALAPRCALPLLEASDKQPGTAGRSMSRRPVIIFSSNRRERSRCRWTSPVNFSRPSIDVLFESAAYAYRDRATRNRADRRERRRCRGAAHRPRVRRHGDGCRIPASAAASAMPSAAIERAGADRIMTLDDMAQALAGIAAAPLPQDRMNETIKILVVDDVPQNLTAIEAVLARPDLELLNARSGDEALELLLVHEVALALIDVRMPGMDGFELAELMRGTERTRAIPIIFMTAASHDPDAHVSRLRGRRASISCTSRSIP